MNTVPSFIKSTDPIAAYLERNTTGSRAVRNTANFIIRNVRTALSKSPEERTHNETEVMHLVFTGIQKANACKDASFMKNIRKYRGLRGMKKAAIYILVRKSTHMAYPTHAKWLLSYEQLDAILKHSRNESYYSCTSQVNQQAIRKTCASWKAYFNALKEYRKSPGKFPGRPKAPGYIRTQKATAHFPNQVCKLSAKDGKVYLAFANYDRKICLGSLPVTGTYVKTEVKPSKDGYRILVTFDDGKELPKVPKHPERILGIDPGVSNFLTCASNTGMRPFIIDGKWLKSVNQGFNKERARLLSILTEGKDPKDKTVQRTSGRLEHMSENRNNVFNDFFYKAAHEICRRCVKEQIEVIVIGHNDGQKQSIRIGHINSQNTVAIPFLSFINKLACVAAKYGIPVVKREESYTSRADLFSRDPIPVYGKVKKEPVFSGRRIKRGLYRAGNGTVLNADVNGACNIARKEYPYAFDSVTDLTYLTSVEVVTREKLCNVRPAADRKTVPFKPNRKSAAAKQHHRARAAVRRRLKTAYAA